MFGVDNKSNHTMLMVRSISHSHRYVYIPQLLSAILWGALGKEICKSFLKNRHYMRTYDVWQMVPRVLTSLYPSGLSSDWRYR